MNGEEKNIKKKDSKLEDEIKHEESGKNAPTYHQSANDPSLFLFPFHDECNKRDRCDSHSCVIYYVYSLIE